MLPKRLASMGNRQPLGLVNSTAGPPARNSRRWTSAISSSGSTGSSTKINWPVAFRSSTQSRRLRYPITSFCLEAWRFSTSFAAWATLSPAGGRCGPFFARYACFWSWRVNPAGFRSKCLSKPGWKSSMKSHLGCTEPVGCYLFDLAFSVAKVFLIYLAANTVSAGLDSANSGCACSQERIKH